MSRTAGSQPTTYLAHAVLEQLHRAQDEIDRHLATGPDGRCLACGDVEPCSARSAAGAIFARYGRLPRRRPGLAEGGDRRSVATPGAWAGWFTSAGNSR
jgi:hypothetical protein